MRKILGFSIFLLAMANLSAADKVPSWFEHSDVLYPSELYISTEGEGNSPEAAEFDCISKISLFFNTTTDVVNKLSRTMRETNGKNYSFSSKTMVDESAKVSSIITLTALIVFLRIQCSFLCHSLFASIRFSTSHQANCDTPNHLEN